MASYFSFIKTVTDRTVLFLRGRKDYEGNCRRDGVSVEDTGQIFSMEETSSAEHQNIVPGPGVHFDRIRTRVRQ